MGFVMVATRDAAVHFQERLWQQFRWQRPVSGAGLWGSGICDNTLQHLARSQRQKRCSVRGSCQEFLLPPSFLRFCTFSKPISPALPEILREIQYTFSEYFFCVTWIRIGFSCLQLRSLYNRFVKSIGDKTGWVLTLFTWLCRCFVTW